MFIALTLKSASAPAERNLIGYVQLHAAPTERDESRNLKL